jgi:hypothetical protein
MPCRLHGGVADAVGGVVSSIMRACRSAAPSRLTWPEDVPEADEFDGALDRASEVRIDPQLPPVVGGFVVVGDEYLGRCF